MRDAIGLSAIGALLVSIVWFSVACFATFGGAL